VTTAVSNHHGLFLVSIAFN